MVISRLEHGWLQRASGPSTKRVSYSLGMLIGGIGLPYPRDIQLLGLTFVDAAQQLRCPRRVADGNIIPYCHAN